MAQDNRGGRRVPREPASYSGVGRNSRRTDQPLRSPNVQDSTDLPVGSREQILQGQRIAPLGRTPSPRVDGSRLAEISTANAAPPMSDVRGGGGIPDWLTDMPTNRADEPLTAGMDQGPGAPADPLMREPADDREALLQWLARGGNQDALDTLSGYRDAQRPPDQPPIEPAPVARIPDDAVEDITLDDGLGEEEGLATEEEPVEAGESNPAAPVETPASAPPDEEPV
jgi:hypothetical protein